MSFTPLFFLFLYIKDYHLFRTQITRIYADSNNRLRQFRIFKIRIIRVHLRPPIIKYYSFLFRVDMFEFELSCECITRSEAMTTNRFFV